MGGWLGGVSTSGTIQGLALVRYNTNGSLDTTFGSGGKVINTGMTYNNFGPMTLAIDVSGRIDVAGESGPSGSGGPILGALPANGALDPTFGTGGVASVPVPPGAASAAVNGLALQSTGEIVICGTDWNSSGQGSAMLLRLNTNGSLRCHSFGTGGFYTESRMATGGIDRHPTDRRQDPHGGRGLGQRSGGPEFLGHAGARGRIEL